MIKEQTYFLPILGSEIDDLLWPLLNEQTVGRFGAIARRWQDAVALQTENAGKIQAKAQEDAAESYVKSRVDAALAAERVWRDSESSALQRARPDHAVLSPPDLLT